MTERSHESIQRLDLTTPHSLPASVIEILGQEGVEKVESLAQLTSGLVEVSKRADPFEIHAGRINGLITPEVDQAIAEIDRIDEMDDSGSDEVSQVARQQAPVLKTSASQHKKFIASNSRSNRDKFNALKEKYLGVDAKEIKRVASEMPDIYGSLEEVAIDLTHPRVIDDFKKVLDAEYHAAEMDAKTVGMQHDPSLHESIVKAWEEAVAIRAKNRALSNSLVNDHVRLSDEAAKKGRRRSLRVRLAHRSEHNIFLDETYADNMHETIKSLRERGSKLGELIRHKCREAAKTPSLDLLEAILALHEKFVSEYLGSPEFENDLNSGKQSKVTEVETYIADRTALAEILIRQTRVKLSNRGRQVVHELKDTSVSRDLRKLAEVAMNDSHNPYEDLPPDPVFRQLCRDARDILVGGGRIDHPLARQLAEDLHKLRFGQDGEIGLEPAESGIIVGIVTGKVNRLISLVERIDLSSYAEDVQLEKLRLELPEQYRTLTHFDLTTALSKLKTILDDERDQRILAGNLISAETNLLVRITIESLWAKVNGQVYETMDLEEALDEESKADESAETEQLPTTEELELIDIEMTEIAEQLEWIVFPPGSTMHEIRQILGDNRVDLTRVNWDRIDHLVYLANNFDGCIYRSREPKLGTSVPYLVAEINTNGRRFAVAECPEVGNATYVVDDATAAGPWQEVMRLSKADARALGARRIIHPKEVGHLNKIVRTINSLLTVKTR